MPILGSNLLRDAGFANAFPERGVGDAALLLALGVSRVVQARQVHGACVLEVDPARAAGRGSNAEEADALFARGDLPVAIGVRVADCVPVLVADPASGGVAAIHAGWRGIVAGVVASSVRRFSSGGLVAAIGPCIGACCFEVGRDVADRIARAGGGGDVVDRAAGEKAFVDLRRAVRAQLVAEGLDPRHIDDVAGCTKHEPARFHSFRRDGADSGRMLAAVVARRPSAGRRER